MPRARAAVVKRTRRVGNPFDDRLEVRLYSTEKAKLLHEAEKRGMSGSDLVRSQLGELIAAKPPPKPEPAPTPTADSEVPQSVTTAPETVDLCQAIADATGRSWGNALLAVRLGKVSLRGELYHHSTIDPAQLAEVTVEGEPLPLVDAPEQEGAGGEVQDAGSDQPREAEHAS